MIQEIFDKLVSGPWSLQRRIGDYGAAQGVATFSRQINGDLHYKEEVQVVNAESPSSYDAFREYIYKQDGDKIVQYFSDHRLFCVLSATGDGSWQGEHLCGDDHYKAIYNFHNQGSFTVTYEVSGPSKNYIIKTEYIKIH